MKKSDIIYVLSAAFVALTSFFYCCTMWFSIRLPRYYPMEHTWKWINEKGVPSQGWYGMQVFAFLAAGILTSILYLVLKRAASADTNLKPAQTKILGIAAIIITILCLGCMMYHEFAKWGVFALMGLE